MAWTKLFNNFFNSEKIGGLLLLACTIISLILANSGWGEAYTHFWHQHADLSLLGLKLNFTIEHWINDGLMTIFFLLVGLEIERELYIGELSKLSNAVLPVVAAIGGMVIPALIHYSFNVALPTRSGFGIPMATDIAFTLGMLALAGNRVPNALKIFVTALAIIDDLGAIIIIAIFYNTGIQPWYLILAAGILVALFLLRKSGVQKLAFYLIPGILLWYCMTQSGIHPTIAGVLLAFVIPFSGEGENTPSYKLQSFLHKPVAYIVLPLFALANTGVMLHQGWLSEIGSRNSLGIIMGLVLGKPLGILLFCWLLIKTSKVVLPKDVQWKNMIGAAALAGIGFTMSIFISNLAFTNTDAINTAKVAVLIASFTATIIGLTVLFYTKKLVNKSKGTNGGRTV